MQVMDFINGRSSKINPVQIIGIRWNSASLL